ncbi:benzyl alcohol O-benzoyltransferase-like [Prosopis cineraria]|uniref:benzyl alcohol O-benzoyltransferase-like n=1 Tax=Prosopis cineraria TaxID=364024 RepID=UPI00240FF689|nr:benzyl alcohol O-benzoyltransferase-like [Prosopis cineraria]
MAPPSGLSFIVRRRQPEMVAPAKATPHEVKNLSDIDDQGSLRSQIPVIQFYRNNPSMRGRDPVEVIRKALAETLVFYYPFAGRLREGPNQKLMVDCNGDGVVFIEADADVTLEEFGDLHPPFPGLEELLYDVPGTSDILDTPLLLIQATRLKCGGFIFALRLNHTMSDAAGVVQFMRALGEIARGARRPLTPPVWRRELLTARDPPRVTCMHGEYGDVSNTEEMVTIAFNAMDMVHHSFFFGPNEIASIRNQIPYHLRQSSNFEIITAFLWRCRTIALQPNDDDKVRIICVVNARAKFNPPLPEGYYGNAFAFPMAVTTAGKLRRSPLGYALELVKKVKGIVTDEYMHSLADFMVINGRPLSPFNEWGTYSVSDVTRAGFHGVDFGWGKAVYGGPARVVKTASFYIPFKNDKGQEGLVVPLCLPGEAMERFVTELDTMLKTRLITSSL